MNHRSLFKHRRGEETSLLTEAVMAVLVTLLVLFVIYLIQKEWNIFTGGSEEEATVTSFEALTTTIQTIIAKPETFIATDPDALSQLFLGANYVLIGYDSNWDSDREGNLGDVQECMGRTKAYKPTVCGTKACLCLYKSDGANDYPEFYSLSEKDEDVIQCVTYPEPVTFSVYFTHNAITGVPRRSEDVIETDIRTLPRYLFLFGDNCGNGEFGTNAIYVEKIVYGDQNVIQFMVQTAETKELIPSHHAWMSQHFGISKEEIQKLIEQKQFVDATLRTLRLLSQDSTMSYYLGTIFEGIFSQPEAEAYATFQQIIKEVGTSPLGNILPFELPLSSKDASQKALLNSINNYLTFVQKNPTDERAGEAIIHALQLSVNIEESTSRQEIQEKLVAESKRLRTLHAPIALAYAEWFTVTADASNDEVKKNSYYHRAYDLYSEVINGYLSSRLRGFVLGISSGEAADAARERILYTEGLTEDQFYESVGGFLHVSEPLYLTEENDDTREVYPQNMLLVLETILREGITTFTLESKTITVIDLIQKICSDYFYSELIIQRCERYSTEGIQDQEGNVIARLQSQRPLDTDYDLTSSDERQNYFDTVQRYAENLKGQQPGDFLGAVEAYQSFANTLIAGHYSTPTDLLLLARTYEQIGRIQKEFLRKPEEALKTLQIAADYAEKAGDEALKMKIRDYGLAP